MYVCVCLKHKGELGWRAGTVCTPVIQHLGRWKLKGQRLKAGLVAQWMDKEGTCCTRPHKHEARSLASQHPHPKCASVVAQLKRRALRTLTVDACLLLVPLNSLYFLSLQERQP